jgi:hypothetical protein
MLGNELLGAVAHVHGRFCRVIGSHHVVDLPEVVGPTPTR